MINDWKHLSVFFNVLILTFFFNNLKSSLRRTTRVEYKAYSTDKNPEFYQESERLKEKEKLAKKEKESKSDKKKPKPKLKPKQKQARLFETEIIFPFNVEVFKNKILIIQKQLKKKKKNT